MLQAFKQKWVSKEIGDSPVSIKSLFLQRPKPRRHARPLAPLDIDFSARSGLSWQQATGLMVALAAALLAMWQWRSVLMEGLYWLMWIGFMGNAVMRLGACAVPLKAASVPPEASNENLPTYSVIVALYKEAGVVPQLVAAMAALHYPRDRMEVLLALEADDTETIAAFRTLGLPPEMRVIEVPDGFPRTKPRALNQALQEACGDLIVIYDAEDRPHPDQLLAAAKAFNAGPAQLACLQAPLRVVSDTGGDLKGFIARQFALEYAVQFDVLLPALHALGLPFPLGGTSNHFKAEVLKAVGGWDAFNVTEDADLGLRLAQYGYRSALIAPPTYEVPPGTVRGWVPQRTRWIKGYMQTLLVHSRLSTAFRPRVWLSLVLGVGLSAVASICYAPFTGLLLMSLFMTGLQLLASDVRGFAPFALRDLVLFATGSLSALLTLTQGARRAGLTLRLSDVLEAPGYWCLQSVAAGFALYQLVTRPFHWDKTDHAPAALVLTHKPLYEDATGHYGQGHDHNGFRHDPAHPGLG